MDGLINRTHDEKLSERIELEDALWDAYDYLRDCKNYTDEMIYLKQKNKECEEEYKRIKNTKASTFFLFVATFYICAVLVALATITPNSVMTIFVIAGIVATIFISRKIFKKKKALPEKKAIEYWENTGSPTCVENNKKIQEIEQELRTYAGGNKKKVEFLPHNIRYDYNAVSYIENAIRNGKADTIKEAMQLYDNHLHQLKLQATMQDMANSMHIHNQAMEEYMSDVVEQQKITNSKLLDIENWTFLDYINNKYGN